MALQASTILPMVLVQYSLATLDVESQEMLLDPGRGSVQFENYILRRDNCYIYL